MKTVYVCCGTNCLAAGAKRVLAALTQECAAMDAEILPRLKGTGCSGFCEYGPIVTITDETGKDITYYRVKEGDAAEIAQETIANGRLIPRLCFRNEQKQPVASKEENPFYSRQRKVALRNVGQIDPSSLQDYLDRGGYQGLRRALELGSDGILEQMRLSGLRGRGGAGFPTASKWEAGAKQKNGPKYIVCNGDEGDPGAFMDGSIMEGDPHSVIEGMLIAALAVGSEQGFLYIRDEYVHACRSISHALEQARAAGFLGANILGSGFHFDAEIVRGGGAFVCGEGSALLESIEGKVGEPRHKPPRTSEVGLWKKPTVTNNVETLANVPYILANGGESFAQIGTESSKGTKVFAMVGKVKRTGLVEVPMGITLRDLIFNIGGGIKNDRPFKAVQTGGPSGGCIPQSMLDLQVDFDNLTKFGAMMGSGGMIVMDDTSCMVEVARYYVDFLCEESCGKCTPCREGLRQMRHILTEICEGRGQEGDLETLERIARTMKDTALCALGRTAANPVLSTIRYFRDEYNAHIHDKYCPAGVCSKLSVFRIDETACVGCGQCSTVCPAKAISGEPRQPYRIDAQRCITCGSCRSKCPRKAILTERRGENDRNH